MRRFFDSLHRAIDGITWLLAAVAGVALFAVLAVNLVGVFMRYIVRSPIPFTVELPSLLMMLLISLALAYAQKGKAHVQVTVVTMHMPPVVRRVLNGLTSLLFLAYAAFIAWGTWGEARILLKEGIRSIEAHIPLFLPVVLVPIGLVVLCLQIVLDILSNVRRSDGELEAAQDPARDL